MVPLKSFITNSKRQSILIFITAVLFFSWLQISSALPDPDSFYHLKMALLIKENGIVQNFPWLQTTILKDNFVDHHLLYHFFLIPFVTIFDPVIGGKISQVILASLTVWLIYWFLRRYQLKGAFFYTLLLFSSTITVFRLSLVKTSALSLMILIPALYLILNKKVLWLFLLSFFYVWTYGGWPMLLILTIMAIAGESFFLSSGETDAYSSKIKLIGKYAVNLGKNFLAKKNLKLSFAVLAGLTIGLIANPYFPKNLSFYWIQVIKIGAGNLQYIIGVGNEWYSYEPNQFFLNMLLVLFLWLFSCAWFFIKIKSRSRESFALILFSSFLFLITLKSSRYSEYFIPFALISAAFSLNDLWEKTDWQELIKRLKLLLAPPTVNLTLFVGYWISLALIISGVLIFNNFSNLKTALSETNKTSYLKEAATFLKENTPQRSVVFNGSWDDFPMLFYYNDHNYYLNGLDQTFMYLKDPAIYFSWTKIINGEIAGKILPSTIKKDFRADYVLIPKEKLFTRMSENVKSNNLFINIYEDEEAAIYEIKL